MLAVRDLPAQRPVVQLRLEDDHGIGIPDRGGQEPLRVGGGGRDRHLHAGRVHVVGLGRVVVQLGRAHPAPVGHPNRQRELHLPARAPAVAPDVRDQLVESRVAERVVLHLADRPPAGHAEPDRGAHDPGLGERRVDAPVGPEAVAQPRRRSEDASGAPHVLAHDHDVLVALELDLEAVVDRLDERQLTHRAPSAARPGRRRTTWADSRTCGRRRARRRPAAPLRPR